MDDLTLLSWALTIVTAILWVRFTRGNALEIGRTTDTALLRHDDKYKAALIAWTKFLGYETIITELAAFVLVLLWI